MRDGGKGGADVTFFGEVALSGGEVMMPGVVCEGVADVTLPDEVGLTGNEAMFVLTVAVGEGGADVMFSVEGQQLLLLRCLQYLLIMIFA